MRDDLHTQAAIYFKHFNKNENHVKWAIGNNSILCIPFDFLVGNNVNV